MDIILKLFVKSGKGGTGPLFGHIRDEISENRGKINKYTGFQGGMKLSLVLNRVCPVLSFHERFQPITGAAMCVL
jgi:hypothetical protein